MQVRDTVRDGRFSIRAISEQAGRMEDVVRLDIGQPDVGTPQAVRDRVQAVLQEDHIAYTSLWGIPELRERIAAYESHKMDAAADNVMVTTGGTNALFDIMATVLDAGDEVLMNDPAWSPYSLVARVAPGSFSQVPYVQDGTVNEAGIRDAITDDTELLLLNTPENPTGRVYSKEEIR
ncbi:MAG: aminotransferase class I/II-fold pyridoxal phosphate-dependent enzyme, partial [Candidatus Nanohaloarchaea archaeon]